MTGFFVIYLSTTNLLTKKLIHGDKFFLSNKFEKSIIISG
ncbi:hypothetical protein AB996_0953 [Lactococcus cremoris]|uniref:Uncharacterized protein n=1 Tax=Lactococcus lactis subsp. cremoris TaxID=1359 RepID=A0A166JUM8_LACLC|nr:hypothetical protein AB996_0953 [Lactococcus cremoris]